MPESLLQAHGSVSGPCAEAMARGVAALAGSPRARSRSPESPDPDGGTPTKPVGTVFVGLVVKGEALARRFHFAGDRAAVRVAIDPGGARHATPLAARAIVKAWVVVALTLALTTCSAASEVEPRRRHGASGRRSAHQGLADLSRRVRAIAGVVRARQGDLDGAIADYTRRWRSGRPMPRSCSTVAGAMIAKKDYQGAIADLTLALSIESASREGTVRPRDRARSLVGDLDLARADWAARDRARARTREEGVDAGGGQRVGDRERAAGCRAAGGNACSAASAVSCLRGAPPAIRHLRWPSRPAATARSVTACVLPLLHRPTRPPRRPRQAATSPRTSRRPRPSCRRPHRLRRRRHSRLRPQPRPRRPMRRVPTAARAARERGARAGVSGDRHRSRRCRAFSGVRGRADKRLAPASRGRAARSGSGAGAARFTRAGGPRPRERAQRGPRRCARRSSCGVGCRAGPRTAAGHSKSAPAPGCAAIADVRAFVAILLDDAVRRGAR